MSEEIQLLLIDDGGHCPPVVPPEVIKPLVEVIAHLLLQVDGADSGEANDEGTR